MRTAIAAMLAIAFHPAFAQTTAVDPVNTIRISGMVIDSGGAPVPNATVTLRLTGLANTATASTHTNQNGRFTFSTLSAKEYDLNFEKTGFKRRSLESIRTVANKDAAVSNVIMDWELLIDHAVPLVPYYHAPLPESLNQKF